MALPDRIQIKIGNETLNLDKVIQVGAALSGLSEKQIYQDKNGKRYFVKLQKPRTPGVIFEESLGKQQKINLLQINQQNVSSETINQANLPNIKGNKDSQEQKADKEKYIQHVKELQDSYSFLEILGPAIIKKIFGQNSKSIIVPDNYLCIQQDKVKGEVATLVLSKELPGFKEFLSQRPLVKGKQKPSDWTGSPLPKRTQLALNPEEAKALGKLLAVAMLMGHLDILNNINLSNSGVVKNEYGEQIPAVVDWGNTLGQGFSGVSAEENAFKNLDLILRKGKLDVDNINIGDFQHCVPFDEVVYPLLPRQIVKDLFNMNGEDEVSRNLFQGFSEVCDEAMVAVKNIDEDVQAAIQEALNKYTNTADKEYIKKILNQSVYFPNKKDTSGNSNQYNLTNVLRGRIYSLMDIKNRIEAGENLEQIAQARLMQILEAQTTMPVAKPTVISAKSDLAPAPLLFSDNKISKQSAENSLKNKEAADTLSSHSTKVPNDLKEEKNDLPPPSPIPTSGRKKL